MLQGTNFTIITITENKMRTFKISYIKTKTIITDQKELIINSDDANDAVIIGYEQLDDSGWDFDRCIEIINED